MTSILPIARPVTPAEHSAATRGECDIGTLARVVMREIGMVRDRFIPDVQRSFAIYRAYRVLSAWPNKKHPTYKSLRRQLLNADEAATEMAA